MAPPSFDENLVFIQGVLENLLIQELVGSRALKLSLYPFSQGEPGSIKAVFAPTVAIQRRSASTTNYGPLSERM